jgi:hypothetical protein
MPANTSKGFPYPLGTDNVADYPTTAQSLATLLESMVPFRMAQGVVSVGTGGSNSASQAVTFPAGLFTVAPIVMVSKTTAQQKAIPNASSPTTSGVTIGYWTGDGTNTAGAVSISWLAIQLTPTIAFSLGAGPVPTDEEIAAAEASERDAGNDPTELVEMFRTMQRLASTSFEDAES